MDNNDFFANIQDGVMTHLDIRGEGKKIYELTRENEKKWVIAISDNLPKIFDAASTNDLTKVTEAMDAFHKEIHNINEENIKSYSKMAGEKMADSYSIGFAEGSYDCMKHFTSFVRERIDDNMLEDPNGNLKRLMQIMEETADEQYNEAFEGKPMTFFSANRPKKN